MSKKFDKTLMNTAWVFSKESSCKRANVGAIISKNGRIRSTGYNGTISGSDNCCEDLVDTVLACRRCGNNDQETLHFEQNYCGKCNYTNVVVECEVLVSKNTVIHAEANALMFAVKEGIKTDGCTMHITLSPCIDCAKLMIQAGIIRVVYQEEYRITDGIEFLKQHNIEVEQLSEV